MSERPIVTAGGSGFLGTSLAIHLAAMRRSVVVLSRTAPKVAGPWKHVKWDARRLGDWSAVLDDAAALVNLVGRSVDCIKTPDHCDEILRSRVEATRALGQAMRTIEHPPPVWVQMSTAHIYGDPPDVTCTEESAFGYGLAPTVARAWEHEVSVQALSTQRVVILRTSFVMGRDWGAGSGALGKLVWLARIGLGGTVGSGRQGISWIHETDMNRLFLRAMDDPTMRDAYIASSPYPVSQREFMRTLRHAVRMPLGLPASSWLVRLAAPIFLRTDPELALYGRYVIPKRLQDEGFDFQFPQLEHALSDLV